MNSIAIRSKMHDEEIRIQQYYAGTKLEKIVINMGVGEAKENAKLLDAAISDMEAITGQKAVTTKAKNSVANFKIREGMPIGCKVTLVARKCTSSQTA